MFARAHVLLLLVLLLACADPPPMGEADAGPALDGASRDASTGDASALFDGAPPSMDGGSAVMDGAVRDGAVRDGAVRDSATPALDAASADAGSTASDAAVSRDAGSLAPDASTRDAGLPDSGARDSGARDSGARDSGSDAGPPTALPLTGANNARFCQLSAAGGGATYVAWSQDTGGQDVYLQRLEADGSVSPGWPAGGLGVATGPDDEFGPFMAPDGAGGVFIVWTDYRGSPPHFTTQQVYATRVRADATFHPSWPVGGLRVSAGPGFSRRPRILADGSGGFYAAFEHDPSSVGTYNRILAQRVSGVGVLAWTDPVPVLASVPSFTNQEQHGLVPDGAGGVIVVFGHRYTTISHDVLGQRFSPSGARLWGDSALVIADFRAEYTPRVSADGSGGALVSFIQNDGAARYVRAQSVSAAGTLRWTPSAAGVRVCCTSSLSAPYSEVTTGPGGDAIVAWHDGMTIDAARLSASTGAETWSASVHASSAALSNWASTSDGAGGLLSVWTARTSSTSAQLYMQRISATGTRPAGWASARETGDDVGFATQAAVLADGAGGAWACWSRTVGGAPFDLLVSRTLL